MKKISTTALASLVTLLASFSQISLAEVELTYADRQFDFGADYVGAKAEGSGSLQELGFHYRDKEYFQFFGLLQESDAKQDYLLGLALDDVFIEYSYGSYNFNVYSTESFNSTEFNTEVESEYTRIDLYWGAQERNCSGGIFGDEICKNRSGISYMKFTAPTAFVYGSSDYSNGSFYDALLDEESFLAKDAEYESIGWAGNIEFIPRKSIGFYRKFTAHIGLTEATMSGIEAICCKDSSLNRVDWFEGDATDYMWLSNYYLAFGVAGNIPLSADGKTRIVGTLSYDIEGGLTMPFGWIFDVLEDTEENETRTDMIGYNWQGIRLGLSVNF